MFDWVLNTPRESQIEEGFFFLSHKGKYHIFNLYLVNTNW